MQLSYEGIGQWAATFACGQVSEGELVKISGNSTVGACGSGESFAGMVVSVSRSGDACAVALNGLVTAGYTGTAPALGWSVLCGNGSGGVKGAASGRSYLVVDVDTAAETVTFAL